MSDHPFPLEIEHACARALAEMYNGRLDTDPILVGTVRVVLAKLGEFGEWEYGPEQFGDPKNMRRLVLATP